MKRDIERNLHAQGISILLLQSSIPNTYTVEEPTTTTPFQQVMVHKDYDWISPRDASGNVSKKAFEGTFGIFLRYVDPVPVNVLENPESKNSETGQWVLLNDVTVDTGAQQSP